MSSSVGSSYKKETQIVLKKFLSCSADLILYFTVFLKQLVIKYYGKKIKLKKIENKKNI